jgi:hypothetical protein
MTVSAAKGLIPGVLVPEGFKRARKDVGISSYALCSVFLHERDLILATAQDRQFVPHRLLSAFSERVGNVSWEQPEIDLHSTQVDRLVRLFEGETVVLGGRFVLRRRSQN